MCIRDSAKVTVIGDDPDGMNINDGVGSTHLERLSETVVQLGADAGIAHDGDADRCLAVDAEGRPITGDQIMVILALAMHKRQKLTDNTLVVTVMSNLGLRLAMREAGIDVVETKVGDRYVLEALGARNLALGGEQSGHVIMSEHATTGDGILTGLHIAAEMVAQGKSLRELADVMRVYPQVLINVRDVRREGCTDEPGVAEAIKRVEAELGDTGRVLLRPSGTEPVVRVMVEAADHETARAKADELANVVRERLALDPA